MYNTDPTRLDRKFLFDGASSELGFIPIESTGNLEPVIYYKFSPQGGTILHDHIGSEHGHLVDFNNLFQAWGATRNRYTLKFTEVGQRVSIPYSPTWEWPKGFTISLWYTINDLTIPSTHRVVVDLGGSFISLKDDGFAYPYFSFNNFEEKTVNSLVESTLGKWIHVVCVAGDSYMGIYVDGVLRSSRMDIATPFSFNSDDKLIGGSIDSLDFYGGLSELVFYNRVLTQSEITALYQKFVPARGTFSEFDWGI